MKKRIVSLFLCVVMLVSLLSVNAFAATGVKLEAQKVETELSANATVKVKVAITENSGIMSGSYGVKWDSSALELTKVNFLMSNLPDASSPAIENNGEYWVSFGNDVATTNVTAKGDAFELVFKVLPGATAKEYPITIEPENRAFRDTDGNIVPPQAVNGSITLKAKTVAVKSVTVSPKTLDLEVGQTGTLTATVKPDSATDKTVTWTVTKGSDVVSVDANGKVTALKAGSATITATAGGKTAACKVTVKEPAHVHDAKVTVEAAASTCEKQGWEAYYKCSVCGAVVDKDGKAAQIVYLPLAAHKLTETKAVPATCTEDGTEAYWTCSVCEKMFADKDGKKAIKAPVKIDALGHDIVENEDPAVVGVLGSKMWLYSATCKNCQKTVYVANLVMPENTINVIAKQSADSKKDFSKAVTFGVKASDSETTLKFTIDPVTADIVAAAKTEAGYKVTEGLLNGAYGWGLVEYSESPEAAYAALAEYLKDGITFTQTISAKEKTWAADAKSHTMTFDINTADGTFTVQVDGKDESTMTFTNTFTYKKSTNNGGNTSTEDNNTKNDGKKVESGKTFDAGIAMYVGLSVLSVTGGALVIGKKKRF